MKTLTLLIAIVLVSASAHAEKCTSPEGKKLWVDGVKAYNLGKWDEAVKAWEGAYDLCLDPEILFNLAQAHRKAGHHAQARDLFKAWLREQENVDPAERADVDKKIAELEALIAAEKKSAEGPPEDVRQEPPPAATPPQPARDAPGPYRTWKWLTLGTGVLAVAGGVTLLLLDEDEFTESGARKPERTETTVPGVVLTATGGALIATGVVLWLLDSPAPSTRVALTPTDGGAVFVVGGRF